LWFLDKAKRDPGKVLFIDARSIYFQLDRAHREFTPEQIAFLGGLVRLYRGEEVNGYTFEPQGLGLTQSQVEAVQSAFGGGGYRGFPGLCKVATLAEIEAQGWRLNPGRYVGVSEKDADEFDFAERLEELNEVLERLNGEAHELEERIGENMINLLDSL
jgi:type I restriction enzyme M protein